MRLVYAANRSIGVRGLALLRRAGVEPIALLLPSGAATSHNAELRAAVGSAVPVLEGTVFKEPEGLSRLAALAPDYILSVHYPYLFTRSVLDIPKLGTLNLHPAFLPYNRGWHTPSWAIIDGTPIGATLHWVDEGVDSGDVAMQSEVKIHPDDTAHSLYQRLVQVELELLEAAIGPLKAGTLPRRPQVSSGSSHRRADLAAVQRLEMTKSVRVGELIDLLRALTTNNPDEAAYFVDSGRRYRVRIEISES